MQPAFLAGGWLRDGLALVDRVQEVVDRTFERQRPQVTPVLVAHLAAEAFGICLGLPGGRQELGLCRAVSDP